MFDSVLKRETLPKRRFGTGAIIAILVHVGVLSFAVWASATGAMRRAQDVAVTFVKPPPPPPPPPPPSATPRQPRPKVKPDQPRTVLQQAIVAPTVIPLDKPPEQEPANQPAAVGAGEGGIEGGEVGGVPGGIVGGVVESAGPLEFDAKKMTEAKFVSGPPLAYTDKAREREVEGTMVVKCVLTVDGRVHDCRVLKSLPFMDRAVIDALERRHYAPVTMGGKPIEVDYTFRIPFRLTDSQ